MNVENERTVLRRELGSLVTSVKEIKMFHKNKLKALKTEKNINRKNRRYNSRAGQDFRIIKERISTQKLQLSSLNNEISEYDHQNQSTLDEIYRITQVIKHKVDTNSNNSTGGVVQNKLKDAIKAALIKQIMT